MAFVNLYLRGFYHIKIEKERFVLGEETVKTKEVPFVRYHFPNKVWDSLKEPECLIDFTKYLIEKAKQFNYSCHMVECPLERVDELLMWLASEPNYDWTKQFVFFVRARLDAEVDYNAIRQAYQKMSGYSVEGIIMEDKSMVLTLRELQEVLKKVAKTCGIAEHQVRLCGSAFCYGSESSCLTAIYARELMAKKLLPDDAPTPSANNQDMTHCSCISYVNIEEDIVVAPKASNGNGAKKKESTGLAEKKPKKIGIVKLF